MRRAEDGRAISDFHDGIVRVTAAPCADCFVGLEDWKCKPGMPTSVELVLPIRTGTHGRLRGCVWMSASLDGQMHGEKPTTATATRYNLRSATEFKHRHCCFNIINLCCTRVIDTHGCVQVGGRRELVCGTSTTHEYSEPPLTQRELVVQRPRALRCDQNRPALSITFRVRLRVRSKVNPPRATHPTHWHAKLRGQRVRTMSLLA